MSHACKQKAAADLSKQPSGLIRRELKIQNVTAAFTTRDFQRIRQNIYKSRRINIPVLPKTRPEVHARVSDSTITIYRNVNLLFINERTRKRPCIFVAVESYSFVLSSSHLGMLTACFRTAQNLLSSCLRFMATLDVTIFLWFLVPYHIWYAYKIDKT